MKFEYTETFGWEAAFRGMRNPALSYSKSDSKWEPIPFSDEKEFVIGPNDTDLAMRLTKAGSPHNKFARQIFVNVDITAPMYWHKEMDTYRMGVEKDSTSTMYRLTHKPFEPADFESSEEEVWMDDIIGYLNGYRDRYLETKDKSAWYSIVKLLPMSYLQRRTYTISYAALASICQQRKGHKLDEWHSFIHWCHTLPHAFIIFGEDGDADGRTDG